MPPSLADSRTDLPDGLIDDFKPYTSVASLTRDPCTALLAPRDAAAPPCSAREYQDHGRLAAMNVVPMSIRESTFSSTVPSIMRRRLWPSTGSTRG